jgi:GNAT superfamily N-acetyltransferase
VVTIRPASLADSEKIADLSSQLGYPATSEAIQIRLSALQETADDVVFVAEKDESGLVGWIHVQRSAQLVSDPFAIIEGLVVDQNQRSAGVGQALVEAAEAWTCQRGLAHLRVRCNIVRERAHRFYQQLGFELVKTQHQFIKAIEQPGKVSVKH